MRKEAYHVGGKPSWEIRKKDGYFGYSVYPILNSFHMFDDSTIRIRVRIVHVVITSLDLAVTALKEINGSWPLHMKNENRKNERY